MDSAGTISLAPEPDIPQVASLRTTTFVVFCSVLRNEKNKKTASKAGMPEN